MSGSKVNLEYAEIGYIYGDGTTHYINTNMSPGQIRSVQEGFWLSIRQQQQKKNDGKNPQAFRREKHYE